MLHPTGYGQQGLSAMNAAAQEGSGGTASGLVGMADQKAAVSHNSGGFQGALDSVARERMKANAGASEGIAASDAQLQQQQQQEGAKGLQGLYGTDTSGMLDAQGQISGDVNAAVSANKTGWLQNAQSLWQQIATGGTKYGGS